MRHPYVWASVLLLPGFSSAAEDVPEKLLPASTQIYLRWDGVDAHRAAYEKTSLGRMMKGDTGAFISGVFDKLQTSSAALLSVESLRRGLDPKALKKMQADAKSAAKLFPQLGKHGFILAGDLRQLEPPQGSVYLILPGMGEDPDPLFGALRLAIDLSGAQITERKIAGRAVFSLDLSPVNLAWWAEGKHAVFVLSTDNPEAIVKNMTSRDRAPLTEQQLFQRVASFKQFETDSRAFVDVSALIRLGAKRGKEVSKLLDDLGMMGLRSLVLYSGFEARAARSLIEWDTPGPRKGLMKLSTAKPFQFGDVPPLPPDVTNWSMSNFDIATLYDTAYQAVEQIVGIVSPEDVPKIKEFTKQVNDLLGVDLRKDLLGSLGDRFAIYTSPGEGPFVLGQTLLLKVKDAEKLEGTLEQIIKNLSAAVGREIRIKKRDYRGVAIREIYVQEKGFIFVPTYTIHKDWMVLSWYPQPVQAFVQRSKGELTTWKPSDQTKSLLSKLPSEFVSISYSDPRPLVKQLMSFAPIIAGVVSSFNPSLNFEVGSLPATQEVTKYLFPNITVTTDDGKTIRQQSLDSVSLPLDVGGLDVYTLFIGLGLVIPRIAF